MAPSQQSDDGKATVQQHSERATFALGSFWGAETVFRELAGTEGTEVLGVQVGFMGGHLDNPTFEDVVLGKSGHAEVVDISFVGSYAKLLDAFWAAHDLTATDVHAQEASDGPLRSAIFYHSPEQKLEAEASRDLKAQLSLAPIQTTVIAAQKFWPAEGCHQERLAKLGAYASCQVYGPRPTDPTPKRPWPGPSLPAIDIRAWKERDDNELTREFGAVFSHWCSPDYVKAALQGSDRHYGAAVDVLRKWRLTHGDNDLSRARVAVNLGSATAEIRIGTSRSELTFIVNFRPGNYLPWSYIGSRNFTGTYIFGRAGDPRPVVGIGGSGNYGQPIRDDLRDGARIGPTSQDALNDVAGDAWHVHIPSLSVDIGCGNEAAHYLEWTGGELRAQSYSDAENERTLFALGGTPCVCVAIVRMCDVQWHIPDLTGGPTNLMTASFDTRAITPRDGQAVIALPQHVRETVASWVQKLERSGFWGGLRADELRLLPAEEQRHIGGCLMTIGRFPLALQVRWWFTLLKSLHDRQHILDPFDSARLEEWILAPVRQSIMATLWQWCRSDPGIVYANIICDYVDDGEPPTARGRIERDTAYIYVAISFKWLTHVWARGVDVVDNQLVLAARGGPDSNMLLCDVVMWDRVASAVELVVCSRRAIWDGNRWKLVE